MFDESLKELKTTEGFSLSESFVKSEAEEESNEKKSINQRITYAFFPNRLGLLFKIENGEVTFEGCEESRRTHDQLSLNQSLEEKVTVISEIFFGLDIKKQLKLPSQDMHNGVDFILESILKAFNLPATKENVLIEFHIEDLHEYVELDNRTLANFHSQKEKLLRISSTSLVTTRTLGSPVNDTAVEVEMPKLPPPPVPSKQSVDSIDSNICEDKNQDEDIFSNTIALSPMVSDRITPIRRRSSAKRMSIKEAVFEGIVGKFITCLIESADQSNEVDNSQRKSCRNKLWQLTSEQPPIGSFVVSINGVQVRNLDKGVQFSLLKQRSRPIIIEFSSQVSPKQLSLPVISDEGLIGPSLFLEKYANPLASKLRSQVDSVIKDFLDCDWAEAKRDGTGLPQSTIASIYKYIESEMIRLELFNSARTQGQGSPETMLESHWDCIRNHIEGMIFCRVSSYLRSSVWALFQEPFDSRVITDALDDDGEQTEPRVRTLFIDTNLELSTIDGGVLSAKEECKDAHIELSPSHSLSMKLAFLRFVTLSHLGLSATASEAHDDETLTDSKAIAQILAKRNKIVFQEEWYLAIKKLHSLSELRTPGDILCQLVKISQLITNSLECYISKPSAHSINCDCSSVHVVDASGESISIKIGDDESVKSRYSDVSAMRWVSCSESDTHATISADDLLPSIIWTLIQANPVDIDHLIWVSAEFRHPSLQRGEEAYVLAQLSSAVEFCKAAIHSSFSIPRSLYDRLLIRYSLTLKLMLACKTGDFASAQELIAAGADVNGLSPDQRDSPLTACIRFQQHELLELLLEQPDIEVDTLVNLYRGPLERATALLIAAKLDQTKMVVSLLSAGANRYAQDDDGVTALSLAADNESILMQTILLADPQRYDLLDAMTGQSIRIVSGLLLQGAEVNYFDAQTLLFSPLIVAALCGNFEMVRLLLTRRRDNYADVNQCNAMGESALVVCVESLLLKPSLSLLQTAVILLRAGASRSYLMSYSALHGSFLDIAFGHVDGEAASCDGISTPVEESQASLDSFPPGALRAFRLKYGSECGGSGGGGEGKMLSESRRDDPAFASIMAGKSVIGALRDVLLLDPESSSASASAAVAPIYECSRRRDYSSVHALLLQGVDVNAADPAKGYTALIAAVYNKDLAMVWLLLQAEKISDLIEFRSSTWQPIFQEYFAHPGDPPPIPVIVNKLDLDKPARAGMTALHYAAQSGETELVGLLLANGASRQALNEKGHAPLDIALTNGHAEAANVLKFDPSKVSICLAAKHGDWAVIKALLAQGISINHERKISRVSADSCDERDSQPQHELHTPLIAALAHGQFEVVNHLINTPGIDFNLKNDIGMTPLMYAAARGDEATVLKLLSRGADRYAVDSSGFDAAYWAAQESFLSLAILIQHDPAVEFIHDVIRRNDFDGVVALLKQRVNPNQRRTAAFLPGSRQPTATEPAQPAQPAESREDDGEPAARPLFILGETPLIIAARSSRLEIMALLLKAPDIEIDAVDHRGWTALFHAAEAGHEEAVLLLLKHKAQRKLRDVKRATALDVAMQLGFETIAAILEADPCTVHIHDACASGRVLQIVALIKQGCPPTFRDERVGKLLQTPLMAAAAAGQKEVVRMLLRSPSVEEQIDVTDALGHTALMLAAAAGALEVTAILLNAGSDRNVKDAAGLTARDHAARHSYAVMFQFMSQSMVR